MINIQCPDSGQTIKVSPGSPGTICVYGDVSDEADGLSEAFDLTVRVRVVAGYGASQPSLLYNPATDRDATVGGTTWCATGVPVPAGTVTGGGLTVFAWFPDSVGSGGTGVAQGQSFYAGGAGDHDCCADSPCASGSDAGESTSMLAGQLVSALVLEVSVPSGAHAGAYRATSVSLLTWEVTIGGVPYRLVCAEGETLTIHGPSASSRSTSVDFEPFTATFPGDLFDAEDEIVVVVA